MDHWHSGLSGGDEVLRKTASCGCNIRQRVSSAGKESQPAQSEGVETFGPFDKLAKVVKSDNAAEN